jgi:hypothetical protein
MATMSCYSVDALLLRSQIGAATDGAIARCRCRRSVGFWVLGGLMGLGGDRGKPPH